MGRWKVTRLDLDSRLVADALPPAFDPTVDQGSLPSQYTHISNVPGIITPNFRPAPTQIETDETYSL